MTTALTMKLEDLAQCRNRDRRLDPDHWRQEDQTCRCHPPRDQQEHQR